MSDPHALSDRQVNRRQKTSLVVGDASLSIGYVQSGSLFDQSQVDGVGVDTHHFDVEDVHSGHGGSEFSGVDVVASSGGVVDVVELQNAVVADTGHRVCLEVHGESNW